MNRLKILDWYCHQGHQYELFKAPHDFYLEAPNGQNPKWNIDHRPLGSNVNLICDNEARKMKFDVVIIRSPISPDIYNYHIGRGAIPVAVVQTTTPFSIPNQCKHVVWNSLEVMNKYKNLIPAQHRYIVHGYDPDQFIDMNIDDNGRVLTIANVFKKRAGIMGFDLWKSISKDIRKLDVIGHGNLDIYTRDKQAKNMKELILIYNMYSVYFNPTISSAMPRSRAEAAMCGSPIVSTDNFDISRYFKHRQNAIISNNRTELISGIKELLANKNMREDYGRLSREIAIKHFHLKDFIGKWNNLLGSL